MVETTQAPKKEEHIQEEVSDDLNNGRLTPLTPRRRRTTGGDVEVVTMIRQLKDEFVGRNVESGAAPNNTVTRFRVARKEHDEESEAA